jgi:hypothetical protein
MKTRAIALYAAMAVSALDAGAASPLEVPACAQSFDRFQQAVSWYEAGNHLLVRADSACSDRHGFPFQLRNLVLSIEYGMGRSLKIEAAEGLYSPADKTLRVSAPGYGVLTAELATGQVRSMSGFYLDLKSRNPKVFMPVARTTSRSLVSRGMK